MEAVLNPFTESTVAKPSFDIDWGESRHNPSPPADRASSGEASEAGDQVAQEGAALVRMPSIQRLSTVAEASLRTVVAPSRPHAAVRRIRRHLCRGRLSACARLMRSRALTACVASTLSVAGLTAPTVAMAVDVNQASVEQLETIRGIGPRTAQTIIQERGRGGPFESIEDLSDRVKGIGPKKAATLRAAGLTVGASALSGSIPPGARSASTPSGPGRSPAPIARK